MSAPEHSTSETQRAELGSRMLARATAEIPYRLRLAETAEDLRAAQTLRFLIFNLELNEGLESSYSTLRDEDPFDAICDHLLVENKSSGEIVGTYRLQSGSVAMKNRGFYSEQEFDFSPFRPIHEKIVELGRACVHSDHRSLPVIGLLWQGISDYARQNGARYLVGCSSLTSQDTSIGAAAYAELARHHLVEPTFRTHPIPTYACPLDAPAETPPKIPKLLRAYLSFGAKICGAPAIDREFKTIDFLTWMDLDRLPAVTRRLLGRD